MLLPLPNGRLSNALGTTGQDGAWSLYFLSGAQYGLKPEVLEHEKGPLQVLLPAQCPCKPSED